MGDLDEAIREHLELKRRHGASDEEVSLKESEAQRQGALPSDAGGTPDAPAAETVPADSTEPGPDIPEAAATDSFESPTPLADELEPDEVLPEETLEPEIHAAPEPAEAAAPAPDWSSDREEPGEPDEDVLEETPEFLEEMPEQDRLWFEQRPPKDFDFDD